MRTAILGISAYYHDSAAAILVDGALVAAAQEERFTRKRHDAAFPEHAVRYVLAEAGIDAASLAAVAFYDKPFLKFERLLETYHGLAPSGLRSFVTAIPVWIKEKLFLRHTLEQQLKGLGAPRPTLLFPEHHLSHAASAFYPSPFAEAAILTIDGVGEWATTTIARGRGRDIELLRELHFPHSVGLLYSAFTYYCGFRVNSGEYKLMGLAPYGNPGARRTADFKAAITRELVDIREDGSILLNMDYFAFATGSTMVDEAKWARLFGLPRRDGDSELTQAYMDLALAIQQVTEDIVLRLAQTAVALTGLRSIVLAGGVALNCVANGKLLQSGIVDDIWIQPAAGDAGGAVGAAYAAWHLHAGHERQLGAQPGGDAMSGAYLGPQYSALDIERTLRRHGAPAEHFDRFDALASSVASRLANGEVGGWFQGRMEFGPRALGNRSILGDARNPAMQQKLNLKIKYREGFRPFAPSVLDTDAAEHFALDHPSPYMMLTAPVRAERQVPLPDGYADLPLLDRLYFQRSHLPAATHVDYSARVQTVNRETNPRYHALLEAFKRQTGCGVLVNTSFNVRGEPIVCTPDDAYRCFMRTEMDFLVLGDYVLSKGDQPAVPDDESWKKEFVPD